MLSVLIGRGLSGFVVFGGVDFWLTVVLFCGFVLLVCSGVSDGGAVCCIKVDDGNVDVGFWLFSVLPK